MENFNYKIEIELESPLDEVKLKQYFNEHFDTAFLTINKLNIKKE